MVQRTAQPAVRTRDAVVLSATVGIFGVSFGVLATGAGVSPMMALAMSALVFAGGSQFAAVGVVAAGGLPWAGVVGGLLLNSRYAALGLAVAPRLGGGGVRRRLLAAHLLVDESAALALGAADERDAQRLYWTTGALLYGFWLAGTGFGISAGALLGDPSAWGLDAAYPAGFLALLAPLLRERPALRAALAGAGIAIVLLPVAPPGVPVLAAGLGVVAGLASPGRRAPGLPGDAS